MIYTVTFNPSLDYIVSVEDFKPGRTNRAGSERIQPGGKGINVSIMLQNLGYASLALGFAAGFTGEELIRRLAEMGIGNDFIPVPDGFTRINLKLKSIEGTEINGQGPAIGGKQLALLTERIDRLKEGDVLFLSGSVPSSVPADIYQRILERLEGKGVLAVADAAGELLRRVLPCRPFLIKPNKDELEEIFGIKLSAREQIISYAKRLQRKGARNVLVSLAGEGAVLAAEDGRVFDAPAPEGVLVNGVGAGDSMAAGFLAGWMESRDYRHAFCMGLAAGSASAFSEGFADGEEVRKLCGKIEIEIFAENQIK